ncbi:hypothetical protein L210DRAFT_3566203 [Boletus edulis BED1]|uniref:Uncharacterized protein n=1 Tax=Boletus edulis BED1 TaxID=1328754 RepID=A0AAD4G8M3_BOLED|nr:hypothetical protein L210DRAFT_3566203 [Boletus edulis BED1]
MGSTDPATAIIPIDLGTVAAFDQDVFPLAYYEGGGDNLSKGTFLIKATLGEVEKIKKLGTELLNNNDDFLFNTRLKVESLRVQKAKLQDNRKSLNPFKSFLNYRAARLFHETSRALYLQTKSTSEKMHRDKERVQVVPSARMRIVNDAISPNALIGGLSVELPNGLIDDAKRIIDDATEMMATANPFQDNFLISQIHDGEQEITLADTASILSQDEHGTKVDEGSRTSVASSDLQRSCPTSPQTINVINVIQNSIVTTNSPNLNGFTLNSGDRNSGASVCQEFPS